MLEVRFLIGFTEVPASSSKGNGPAFFRSLLARLLCNTSSDHIKRRSVTGSISGTQTKDTQPYIYKGAYRIWGFVSPAPPPWGTRPVFWCPWRHIFQGCFRTCFFGASGVISVFQCHPKTCQKHAIGHEICALGGGENHGFV